MLNPTGKQLVIVFGNQLEEGDQIGDTFKAYLDMSLELVRRERWPHTTVLVSGGTTVAGRESEAVAGKGYLDRMWPELERLKPSGCTIDVVAETESRTTKENVENSLKLMRQYGPAERLVLVGRYTQLHRARAYMFQLRKQLRAAGIEHIEYEVGPNSDPLYMRLAELFVLVPLAWLKLDGLILWVVKKVNRNG